MKYWENANDTNKFWPFFIATGLGQLPATIIYSYVGGMLTGGAQLFVTGLLILFALTVFIVPLAPNFYFKTKGKSIAEGQIVLTVSAVFNLK